VHTQDLREASNIPKHVVQQTTASPVSYSTSSGHLLRVASPAHILHDKPSPQPYATLPVLAVPTTESASLVIDPILSSSPLISTTATSQASNTPQLGNSLQSRHSEEDPWLSSPSTRPFVTAVSGLASTQMIPSPMSLTNLETLPAAVESRERSPMSQPTHV
jgi:hypothetical protein